jgi:hypothetical protein|tara:strand:- start:599 stop:931 length:333 start_codon:yes stop_codon:yes gene_type:complete
MMEISIRRDRKTGLLHIKTTPENKLLEEFFETEIQNDLALIDYVYARLARQEDTETEITGNAFSLLLTHDRYIITPLFEQGLPPFEGPQEEFLHILDCWRKRLEKDNLKS